MKYDPSTQTDLTYIRVTPGRQAIVILNGKRDALAGCSRSEECNFGDRCIRAHPALDFRVDHTNGMETSACQVRIVPR